MLPCKHSLGSESLHAGPPGRQTAVMHAAQLRMLQADQHAVLGGRDASHRGGGRGMQVLRLCTCLQQ